MSTEFYHYYCLVASVVYWLVCLPLYPKVAGSNTAEAMYLRAIKIRITSSFGCEVKPEDSCKIFRHFKERF
jgi:hypothetical protein